MGLNTFKAFLAKLKKKKTKIEINAELIITLSLSYMVKSNETKKKNLLTLLLMHTFDV